MQTHATAQTRPQPVTPHGRRSQPAPAGSAGAPAAASTRHAAPRAPRSVRWAAGLASVFVTLTLFSTVIDTFEGSTVEGPWASAPSTATRG